MSRWHWSVWVAAFTNVLLTLPANAQQACPPEAVNASDSGWVAYQEGRIADAETQFRSALAACPGQVDARTGLAYVLLRNGQDARSRALFQAILRDAPQRVDVITGLGLLAWRRGDLEDVSRQFRGVLELSSEDPTALEYLSRLPAGLGPAPQRPPLVLPDTVVYTARVNGERFEVRGADGWEPFYVKGVNLGAALPGRFASQFPDSTVYADWIEGMGEMGANSIRVYTIHPPYFYGALAAYNAAHADSPLRLIHGVWTELPPEHDYLARDWEDGFFEEIRRVVDLLHGRADIRPRPGHASGFYTTDVSEWVLGYIIGREWEPFSVQGFNASNPGFRRWAGRYVRMLDGTPMDAWLAKAVDELVTYETDTYRAQRPAAYTNWPTLDPLSHPTETTRAEEVRIRRSRGETVDLWPREFDNDIVGLDATLAEATAAYPAGYFVSYHAYPYYPDLMILDPEYGRAESSFGPSRYAGYLEELKRYHEGMAVVISEYGVPASLGSAHLQPDGLHHGGNTEASMAQANRRMTLELAETGMAGGALFAWIDEWFKRNWIALEFEIPDDRNRLWLNRMDAEQHYGVYAMDAEPAVPGASLRERLAAWREMPPFYQAGGSRLRVASDEAYLWLMVDEPGLGDEAYHVGFDVIDPRAGDFRWPGGAGERLGVGLEYVLTVQGDEARLVVDPPQNPFRFTEVGQGGVGLEGRTWEVGSPLPGLFRARAEQRFNIPYYTVANEDGRYDSLRVLTNRRRFARDGTEYLALGYDRGILRQGDAPDGLWQRIPGGGFEVRIPWLLLNVTDPSSRSVLQGPGENQPDTVVGADGIVRLVYPDSIVGVLGTDTIESIGIVTARGSEPEAVFPATGSSVARYGWDTWEEPRWRSRRRPVFEAMRDAFGSIAADGRVTGTTDEPSREAASPPPPPAAQVVDSANAAWLAGDVETAERLYRARLQTLPSDEVALHRIALVEAWNARYEESIQLFDRLLVANPENVEARVDRARVFAWRGDLSEALAALDVVLQDDPTNRLALPAAAQFQAWAGQMDASLSMYDQLLAVNPDDAAVRRAQAQTFAWADRFDAAREVYEGLLRNDPSDQAARLGLATLHSFDNDIGAALSAYDTVLVADPRNAEALRGRARALSWGGKLVAGEAAWRATILEHPQDVQAQLGLGQNLRWQGRPAAALPVLEAAERAAPTNEDIQEQLRWIYAVLGPRASPDVILESDSDDNFMFTTVVSASWFPRPRLNVNVKGFRRMAEQGTLDREAQGIDVTGSYQFSPGWLLSAGIGGSESDGTAKDAFAHLSLGLKTPGRYPAGVELRFRRYALGATALLIERGVEVDQFSADGRWVPAPGWRVNASAGLSTFRTENDNDRWNAALFASRRFRRRWSLGLSGRAFGFDEDLNDGYFDPDRYWISEVVGGWFWSPGRLTLSTELVPGAQKIGSGGDLTGTFRVNAGLVYRLRPGREISLHAGYSSTGLQAFATGESGYRYTALVLSISWVLGSRVSPATSTR